MQQVFQGGIEQDAHLLGHFFPLAKCVYVYSHQGLRSPWQWSEVAITFHPVGFCTVVVLFREPDT